MKLIQDVSRRASCLRSAVAIAVYSLCFFSLGLPSFAAPNPPSETAGAEESRFKQEKEAEKRLKVQERQKKKEEIIQPEAPASQAEVRFRLKKVVLAGNEAISVRELQPIADKLLNREMALADVEQTANEIKRYYRNKGYIACYVYIPPQKLEEGRLEIRIVEGKLGVLSIWDNRWFSEPLIRRQFHVKPHEIIRYDPLRSDLTALNKQPDIDTRAVLKPGAQPGTTDVEIRVKDQFPVHGVPQVNNLGTRNTGKERYGVALSDSNLFGKMDQLSSTYQIGTGAWAVGGDYSIPINSYGTRIGASYAHAAVNLKGDFKPLDVEGRADVYSGYLLQPILRKGWLDGTASLGFDWKSIKNRQLGVTTGKDELRILKPGLSFEETDRYGKTFFPGIFNIGFSGLFGASDHVDNSATRQGTGGQFFYYNGSLVRYQRLPWESMLSLRGTFQLSADSLPPSEQLRMGGATSIRGYQEGEYLADYGGYGNAEIWVPSYVFPSSWKLPFSEEPLYKQVQFIGFFDYGGGRLRKPLVGEDRSRWLAGAGAGLRIHLYSRVYGRVEWGFPVGGSSATDGRNSAFYFGVSVDALKGLFK